MNVKVAQNKERKGEGREQVLRGEGTIGGGPLVGAVRISDVKPGKRKVKEPRGGKDVECEQVGEWRGHRKDGGGGDEVRVNIERHGGALVGRAKTFPGRERGEFANPYQGIL